MQAEPSQRTPCPRCYKNYVRDAAPAVSRIVGETAICDRCGEEEAMEEYTGIKTPWAVVAIVSEGGGKLSMARASEPGHFPLPLSPVLPDFDEVEKLAKQANTLRNLEEREAYLIIVSSMAAQARSRGEDGEEA